MSTPLVKYMNSCKRKTDSSRIRDELIDHLLTIKWWDWPDCKILDNLETLCSGELTKIKGN